jgi:hypothetical protein
VQQNRQRFHSDHHDKHRCLGCTRHRSVFLFRGRVRADADHNLCPRCYRSHRQRLYNWCGLVLSRGSRGGEQAIRPAFLKKASGA